MASFYAELLVEGNSYRVVHCRYACHQATDARGRVQAKVRYAPLELVLDVPTDDGLLAWAHAPHKPLAGQVVFYDTARQTAHETIAFAAGECVQYAEDFASSATGDGAYVCQLTITAPSFELRAGGPATPLAAGRAAVADFGARNAPASFLAGEVGPEAGPGEAATRAVAAAALSPALAAMLGNTIVVAGSAGVGGPADFEALVKADLQAIYSTPTGQRLLDSLHASGQKTYIQYAEKNAVSIRKDIWQRGFYALDGVTPGQGMAVGIEYNPVLTDAGPLPWNKRPPAIGLAHELIHAEQAAYGRMRRFDTENPGGPDPRHPAKPLRVPEFELDTIGVHPIHQYALTENQIRAEWNPPQGRRDYY